MARLRFSLAKVPVRLVDQRFKFFLVAALGVLLGALLAGCGQGTPLSQGNSQEGVTNKNLQGSKLTVFAAASLTESFQRVAQEFQRLYPGTKIVFNFGGTPTLQQQLEGGAPADVFVSADEKHMQEILKEGLVEQPQDFVTNKLVLITTKTSPVKDLQDLARGNYRLVICNSNVPVGHYALSVLDNLNRAYGPDFKNNVLKHVVSQEIDVKQVVAKVQLGEADAGFVYGSDVTPAVRGQVRVLTVPDAYNIVARYPAAVVKSSHEPKLAHAFVQFLVSRQGQKTMADFGFGGLVSKGK